MLRLNARDMLGNSKTLGRQYFNELIFNDKSYDYQFTDVSFKNIMVIGDFVYQIPAFKELYKDELIGNYLGALPKELSHFLQIDWEAQRVIHYVYCNGNIEKKLIDDMIQVKIINLLSDYRNWVGFLDANGDHIIDLKKPSPSPHFSTNMLLGNRMGFPYPLQTTPKSVVDRLGGGSFRSHAATQVLATR